jgi:hypothetical protein
MKHMENRAGRSGLFTDSSAYGPGPPATSSDRSDVVPSARDIFLPEQEAFEWVERFRRQAGAWSRLVIRCIFVAPASFQIH